MGLRVLSVSKGVLSLGWRVERGLNQAEHDGLFGCFLGIAD